MDWDKVKRLLKFDVLPFRVVLCLSEEEWLSVCEALNIKDRTWIEDSEHARVVNFSNWCVIQMGGDQAQAHVCVHESVHVFQALCQYLSEDSPSAEFQAYYIGYISEWVIRQALEYYSCRSSTSGSSEPASPSQSSSEDTSTLDTFEGPIET